MNFNNILYEKDDSKQIVKITVNRPEVRNALNKATRQDIKAAVEITKKDMLARVLIITGSGDKSFISGADITELVNADPIEMEIFASTLGQQLYSEIENLDIPVIAMINGYCLGAGCELAMACDIRIASESAKFGQPEISVGIIPGGGGTQRLPRLIGWGIAKEMVYTGKIVDAIYAQKIGLVDDVVPDDNLGIRVNQLVEAILSKSQLIVKLAKKSFNRGMYTDLAAGLNYEKDNFALCFSTKDQKEGMTAFLQKRKPDFTAE